MTDHAHTPTSATIAVGTVIGIVIAAVFCWLFSALAGVDVTSAAIVAAFVLLAAWTVAGAVMYGRDDEESHGAEAH